MKRLADIAVFSRDYRITLVVEVKGQKHATDEWAAKLRRNLLAHDMIPPSQYFLLALPDHFYLWKENAEIDLVVHQFWFDGYKDFNFMRASAVVKRQSTFMAS